MREPRALAYYAIQGEDGFPRAMHAYVGLQPPDAVEITEAQAAEISAAVRAREPRFASEAGASVNLQPLQDQIDALAQAVIGHAKTLDQHDAEVKAVNLSVTEYLKGQKDIGGGEG